MKKYRTKPWAKGLACGLFVLAMTVSVICLGNVRWLAYHGGYQWEGTRQLVEEEEAVWVENLTNQLADGYRSYRDGDQSLDVKRYVEDENFFFTIKDLEGNTLLASDTLGDYREKTSWSMQVGGTVQWSHIDQYYDSYEARDLALDQLGSTYEELQNVSLVEDEEGYRLTADVARTVGKETVVLTGFLRSELSPTGQVYQGIQYAENMGFYRYEFLAGAILGLVLGVIFTQLGVVPKNLLQKAQASGFINMVVFAAIIPALANISISDLIDLILPLVVVFAVSVLSIFVMMKVLPVWKILGDKSMAFGVGFCQMLGFPSTYLISVEVCNAVAEDEDEKAFLMSRVMPRLVVGGMAAMVSILVAGVMAGML